VLTAGADRIQRLQLGTAPVGPDDNGRAGQDHQDLAAADSDRPGLGEVPDGNAGRELVAAGHHVEVANRSGQRAARRLAGPVEAERLMPSQDVVDPVDHQGHPLPLDHSDDPVDSRKAGEGTRLADLSDADPPVTSEWPGPAGRDHLTGETTAVAPRHGGQLGEADHP
jgi:hypothetical protein